MRPRFAGLACLIFILLFPFNILSAAESPHAFIKNLENEMRVMMRSGNFEKANALFVDKIDFTIFAKRCLADHWNEFTPDEHNRFINLFEGNVRKKMNEKMLLTKNDANFKLTPVKTRTEEGLIKIDNFLKVKRGTFGLGILMTNKENRLRVVDYDLDGALLSRNYRGHFNFVIRKYGKGGFFERLEKKLVE